MDPHEALADLTQISVQIAGAAIVDRDGSVLGSTLSETAASERLARLAGELWEAADRARKDLARDELAQLEVATPDGSVFLVHDGVRSIVATTSSDPTVGLVFYDLKSCLRSVAEDAEAGTAEAQAERGPAPEAAPPAPGPPPEPEAAAPPPAAPPPPPEPDPDPPVAIEEAPVDPSTPRPFSSSSPVFRRGAEEPMTPAQQEEFERMLDGDDEEEEGERGEA
jgi:predicted regulator of Ras-like GTPase activity (Roadblock/LC7/MglB family)